MRNDAEHLVASLGLPDARAFRDSRLYGHLPAQNVHADGAEQDQSAYCEADEPDRRSDAELWMRVTRVELPLTWPARDWDRMISRRESDNHAEQRAEHADPAKHPSQLVHDATC